MSTASASPSSKSEPAAAQGRAPSVATINAAVVVLCLIWGTTWLVIREGLKDLPAFTSAGMRFGLAAAVMGALAPLLRRREGGGSPPPWLWLTNGLLNFGAAYAIVYWCERTLPSGWVSLLWAIFPMLMAISGHYFLTGERLRRHQWLGFVVGFGGVALLFRTDLHALGPEALLTALLFLVSPLVSCAGTTLVKRYGASSSSALLNRNGMAVGAALLLAMAALSEDLSAIRWTPRAIFSVTYLALAGTVATFGLYFWAMRYAPAHRLSLIAYVTPAIALLLGWAVGEEPISRYTLMGSALVLGGVVLVIRAPRAHRAVSASSDGAARPRGQHEAD